MRTGISLVSVANARLNLEQEMVKPFGWDFAAVVQGQRRAWNEIFNRVESRDARRPREVPLLLQPLSLSLRPQHLERCERRVD